MEVVNALGRRKRAIARVFVSEGTGKITINKRPCRVLSINYTSVCCKTTIEQAGCC